MGVKTRRLIAFGVDYAVILGWIALITGAGFLVRSVLDLRPSAPLSDRDKLLGHALGLVTLTLPVLLYFALAEQSSWRGTPGKRRLGLEVGSVGGGSVPMGRSMLRSALKFAPWELAHTVIWHSPGQPFVSPPDHWGVVGYAVSLAVAAWYVASLFVGDGRTPYDRAAGTVVRATDRGSRASASG
jgi:uncharacterized RDD family membrane protein YckC